MPIRSSSDFMFCGEPLIGSLDEEGVLDTLLTTKEVREWLDKRGLPEAKSLSSKALSEAVDGYQPTVYHRFSDKRFRTAAE
jgi:hypothetical protein